MSTLPAVAERLLRYVRYDTQSDESSNSVPSTLKQLELSRLLVQELQQLGLADAELDARGCVMATLPGNVAHPVPIIALMAHVDTSPELTGANVQPQVHAAYDGGPLRLGGEYLLTPEQCPELRDHVGHTIITTDGSTLLGADDKAGIAEIMTLLERLARDPKIPHGTLRVAFSCDEEIGRGADRVDVRKLGAQYGYTVDGETWGQVENETFCADSAHVTCKGVNVHPGYAKDKLVNALKVAARFVELLPRAESPEATSGRHGYVHPVAVKGGVEEAVVKLILRHFELDGLEAQHRLVAEVAEKAQAAFPGARVFVSFEESYRNMRYVLDHHPDVVQHALDAVRRAGLQPELHAIRGGTDGARLSYMGLPTPNIFTGAHMFHSRYEWVAVEAMEAAVETLVQLVQIWVERSAVEAPVAPR
ncbi:MAG: peptidase T [Deltaproteobacteria bacterium]|nr:peptidase T [Deltaproteobacteria bacterium]